MRAVNFVERLQWPITGNVFRHGLAIGDVDNDGDNELVIGTSKGDLHIFKGSEIWHKTSGLGSITCLAIGDIFNYGRNALVVICGDGWVHIFYSPKSVHPGTKTETSKTSHNAEDSEQRSGKMECVHRQRIPTNTKIVLVADIDHDGSNEMIIGLTDRVVRSYRWSSNADLGTGKLIGLNKWECANQIGSITLQHNNDGTPTLLVAQPGGTFMRIKCSADDGKSDNESVQSEAAASCIDYQTLGISRMRNPNISTEIIGNLKPMETSLAVLSDLKEDNEQILTDSQEIHAEPRKRSLDADLEKNLQEFTNSRVSLPTAGTSQDVDQIDGNVVGGSVILGEFESVPVKKTLLPSFEDFSRKVVGVSEMEKVVESEENVEESYRSKPYALATLDGTIMLVKDEMILWSMHVDHQLFALSRLDVTLDGADEIVVCAWDGQTYFLDQRRNCVRFQFQEPVRSFCAGKYSLVPGVATPSLVYITFTNKIFLYYDVILPSLIVRSLPPLNSSFKISEEYDKLLETMENDKNIEKTKRLTESLLYGFNLLEL